ncbi:MAG TPA: methyltransferase [Methylomirabilota bacterium]|jgi:hypothetical protein
MSAPAPVHESRKLLEMAEGYRLTQVLYATASLRIMDHLRNDARTAADLARLAQAHEPSLRRLLQALVSLGLVTRHGERFSATASGECLAADRPGSIRSRVLFHGGVLYTHWADLCHSVRTGETAYQRRYGTDAWTVRQNVSAAGTAFDDAMHELATERAALVADAYDFHGLTTLVDVGGGRGAFLAGILRAHPRLGGVLFDRPAVVAAAAAVLTAAGVAERCHVVAGSFFESVPSGADGYILSVVIHDWDDAAATAILRRCRRAMEPHARLVLVERVIPDDREAALDVWLSDLNMMSQLGGRERSAAEFQALLAGAGFRLARILPTDGAFSIIEAWPTMP